MPKEYDKPEVAPGNRKNLATIYTAAENNALCLMAATAKVSDRPS